MKVLLFQPQIPQNTGNIVRTCSVTGTGLVLVTPLGFSITDRWLKRAGLDYWEGVNVEIIDDLNEYLENWKGNFTFLSSKATQSYSDIAYGEDHLLIFGSETEGLPEWIHKKWPDKLARIPMIEGSRCLNLATSVGITVFEGYRQRGYTH